ncbi:MAG: sigma-70 family RNA polymerase sigma factor [Verrucomicrobiales bacterium]|nr:sigma-70 family RNA polymerase sigma factor [Verrucomicrobiales bacterium]
MSDVTRILNDAGQGNAQAAEELLPVLYEELRRLAASKLANEAPGQTLQPTALVHEAWLRLVQPDGRAWANRAHFFAAAAEAMRRVLVDNARRKRTAKHGGHIQRLNLDDLDVAITQDDETLLAIHDALDRLAQEDSQCADLIKLRFFAGFSNVEAAELLGMAERTAKRSWAYARARLYEELKTGS